MGDIAIIERHMKKQHGRACISKMKSTRGNRQSSSREQDTLPGLDYVYKVSVCRVPMLHMKFPHLVALLLLQAAGPTTRGSMQP